jgi:hypothetical protein
MVFEVRFMEGGALIETWEKMDFIPQKDTVVTMKNGLRYKVKGVAIHSPPQDYLRLAYAVKVVATVEKE